MVTLASQKFVNLSRGNTVGAKPATRESTCVTFAGDMNTVKDRAIKFVHIKESNS